MLKNDEAKSVSVSPALENVGGPAGGVDVAAISGASQVRRELGDPSSDAARSAFLQHAKANGFAAARTWLLSPAQSPMRRALRWWMPNRGWSGRPP